MNRILFVLCLLGTLTATAQSKRVYYADSNTLVMADSAGNAPQRVGYIGPYGTRIQINVSGSTPVFLLPAQVLNKIGAAYSTSSVGATLAGITASIPSGGSGGSTPTISIGTTTTTTAGNPAQVTNTGSPTAALFNFVIPQGPQGVQGVQGLQGQQGTAGTNGTNGVTPTINIGTVTALAAGATPTVTNTGTSTAATFNFGIPAGATGASGSGGSANVEYVTYVTDKTSTGIQNAVNSASAGTTLVLYGTYAMISTVTVQKSIKFLAYNATLDGGTTNSVLIKVNTASDVTFEGVKFVSANTTIGYGMLLINEEGAVKNLLVNRCEFTGPSGAQFNAISVVAYSEQSGNGVIHEGLKFTNNWFHNLPRMAIELVNHQWNGTFRIINVDVSNNRMYDLGLVGDYGMGISFSGEISHVTADNNIIREFKAQAIEFIGTKGFTASNNVLQSTKTWGGSYGSNGYNLTDGSNTDNSNPGHGAKQGTITGGSIDVNGRPIQVYYANNISFTGMYMRGGNFVLLQHGDNLKFTGVDIESAYQSCIIFDATTNCLVTGGTFSTTIASGGKYEQLGFYNSSTGNFVLGSKLFGTSDNGFNIKQNSGVSGNRWDNVLLGSIVLSNATYTLQYQVTGLSTTSGTNQTLTHNFGSNTGIDRIIAYENGTRVSVDMPFNVSSVTDTQVTIQPVATTTYTIIIIGHKLQ